MSSGSESDDEYVPGKPEQVSEEDSANEETELQYESELEKKSNKRKSKQTAKTNKITKKTRSNVFETSSDTEDLDKSTEVCVPLDPVKEKKREDDLWAKFLEGTDTKPKASVKEVTNKSNQALPKSSSEDKNNSNGKQNIEQNNEEIDRERRIFEFAGETIVVENNVIKEKIKSAESTASASKLQGQFQRSRGGGGLSNVLDQLNKKNKLSTLEKSKLDWDTYKKDEGIEEEVVSHNKGKAGYLDRRDFLERTDVRQYELEREVRMGRRSNR